MPFAISNEQCLSIERNVQQQQQQQTIYLLSFIQDESGEMAPKKKIHKLS